MPDSEIFKSKTALMQRAADWVRVGYQHYAMGTVQRKKAHDLVRKFQRNYFVAQNKNERFQAKKLGDGCASLLLWESAPGILTWVLLVSNGEHPAHHMEKLRNAHEPNGRLVLTGYELVRHTRRGSSKPSWTWRMQISNYEAWRIRVIQTCRNGNDQKIRQTIHSLYHTPGFSQCRSQVGKLMALFKAEWARSRPSAAFPDVPTILPYVRRFKASTVNLSEWIEKTEIEAKPRLIDVTKIREVADTDTINFDSIEASKI
ncbi:hypothetical protein [Undibacterium macrobrachii]|jgi:hypothetical protein|nr:hypothetical protein [Undibacterium macrobrachii]